MTAETAPKNVAVRALSQVPRILKLKFVRRRKVSDFRIRSLREEVGNLPNLITLSRLVLIPIILVFLDRGTPLSHYIASVLFIFAGFSDFLDGYLARRTGKITLLGKFLDPLADKITTLSVMVTLVAMQLIPTWLLILMLVREFAVTGLRALAMGEGVVIAASESGKQKTAFQFFGLTFLLVHFPYPMWGTSWMLDFHRMGLFILYLSLILSLFSAVEYFALFVEAVERKNLQRARTLQEAAREAGLLGEMQSNPSLPVVEEIEMQVALDPVPTPGSDRPE
ncbi:CDP-diacylglycerol--glycerol-3-phosphate 3-phosphatidyltransferase [Myxococcota bacterium]|nr:CDP-diacylglycerol--glycerol-3-phosphate 3-phosphatidyltransferase [Myxococcota bacterium]